MSKSDQQKTVLTFLVQQNRPMSANDILAGFTGQLTKTSITNALDTLVSDQKISEKTYGKQKVYMALQSANIVTLKQDLRDMEEKKFMAKAELSRLTFDSNTMEGELKGYVSLVPIGVLEAERKKLFDEVESLKEALSEFRSAKVEVVSKEEKARIQKERVKYVKEWRKYKRIANEMISAIVENCNMSKASICEDLCLVLDEDEKVQIPEI